MAAAIVDCSPFAVDPVLPFKKAKLRKAFITLDDHRAALTSCLLQWKEVEEYLAEAENDLQRRLDELCEKEKAFEARVKETEELLCKREEAIAEREQVSFERVRELKDSAIAALLDEKRKWSEVMETSQCEVSMKKTASMALSDSVEDRVSKIDQEIVRLSLTDKPQATDEKLDACSVVDSCVSSKDGTKEPGTSSPKTSDLKLRQHLKDLCERMDGSGLRKYMVERRKDVNGLRSELPHALKSASDPATLVLDSLEDYCFTDHHSQAQEQQPQLQPQPQQSVNTQGEKKESRISANRRACILLMECLCQVLAHPTLGPEFPIVPDSIKERAKTMADGWKAKMRFEGDVVASNSLDAQAFLQLLGTFCVAHEYEKDHLCKLVTIVARRRQTPALCRSLGLTAKIPDIVDQLASDGKQMEAISLAHAFGIMDRIQPGPLLKAYLKEAKKSAQLILKTGPNSPATLNDSTTKELAALKSVLKCIEEFELESEFPSSPLQKRVLQLEKTKLDRKRVAVAVKAQAKRPRANSGNSFSHLSSVPSERTFLRPPERPQYGSIGLTSYGLAMAGNFDRTNQGSYGSAYTTASRTPVGLPPSYLYTADGLPSPVYGSAAYGNPPANFAGYQFGSGLPPPTPAYPTPFLH